MTKQITTWHLVMESPSELRPRVSDDNSVLVSPVTPPNPHINHAMFMEVGAPFRWFSRLSWSFEEWRRYVNDERVQTWLGKVSGSPFGYFELQQRGETIEIMFLGLLLPFAGRGLGAHLVTRAIQAAWQTPGTERVYLHTCTWDHEAALRNYQARGFHVLREEVTDETVPDPDDPIWSSPAYYRSLRD